MQYSPWVGNEAWEKEDPKLKEASEQPFFMPHTGNLAQKIAVHPPGIIIVRGPRQTGKSTFLREYARRCLRDGIHPENVVLFDVEGMDEYHRLLASLSDFLKTNDDYKIILLDELTCCGQWWKALKILADRGELRSALIVGTGSSSNDLRAGADRLPGRRGKRYPVDYELLPLRYADAAQRLSLDEFFLTGGMPWAINEYLRLGEIPAHVYELSAAWIQSAMQRRGHSIHHLKALLNALAAHTATPASVQKLSRDCGIGSNRTAETYLSVLQDLYAAIPLYWKDAVRRVPAPRKNRKFYAFDPFLYHVFAGYGRGWDAAWLTAKDALRDPATVGRIAETCVAAELRHRYDEEDMGYWLGKREIDFITPQIIEVKYQNRVSIAEFAWVEKVLPPGTRLRVVTRQSRSLSERVECIELERWLLE